MAPLSDDIEQFIKELLQECNEVSLQRNELAQLFACAPSQINYVLSTRFTIDHGYIIASRRGGGGYIRVERVDCGVDNMLYDMACNRVGESLTKNEAFAMVNRLLEENYITEQEGRLMKSALDSCALPTQNMQDILRARIMKNLLTTLMQGNEKEEV